jgi:hypothetical protein
VLFHRGQAVEHLVILIRILRTGKHQPSGCKAIAALFINQECDDLLNRSEVVLGCFLILLTAFFGARCLGES